MAGGGSKKGERRGGRQKGTPNKFNADVKAMILQALDKAGGVEYLWQQSEANPTAFMALVGKVLPMTVAGDPDSPLRHEITTITRKIVDASARNRDGKGI